MIKADESQNALVLIAEPAQIRTIENIVRQLDQPRAQVLIHAAIVEISGDIAEAVGVQWSVSGSDAKGFINFPGTDIPIIGGLNFDEKKSAPEGAILQLGSDRFGALVSALASNTRSNLLSTPSLLTLDNQEAEIIVGQNVPFKTGSYATNSSGAENPFTTVERKDVGISLKIKPYINEGSTLRLEVEQEVSDIAPSVSGVDSSDLITNKRALKSTILADDGEIIVIGGLIRDSVRTQQSGVPLLRDIPYLGALFRWTRDTQTKSNLMVFLRPTIVRSKEDLSEVSQQRYNALRELSKPGAQGNNSLLLPADSRQLFDPASDAPVFDLRKQTPVRHERCVKASSNCPSVSPGVSAYCWSMTGRVQAWRCAPIRRSRRWRKPAGCAVGICRLRVLDADVFAARLAVGLPRRSERGGAGRPRAGRRTGPAQPGRSSPANRRPAGAAGRRADHPADQCIAQRSGARAGVGRAPGNLRAVPVGAHARRRAIARNAPAPA